MSVLSGPARLIQMEGRDLDAIVQGLAEMVGEDYRAYRAHRLCTITVIRFRLSVCRPGRAGRRRRSAP